MSRVATPRKTVNQRRERRKLRTMLQRTERLTRRLQRTAPLRRHWSAFVRAPLVAVDFGRVLNQSLGGGTVSDHHRSQQARDASGANFAIHTDLQQPIPPTPFDLTERNDPLTLLSDLLGELDPPKREVFMLAELEEMTVPEIADALEIPLNTAYSRLRAARLAFEAVLARQAARRQSGSQT